MRHVNILPFMLLAYALYPASLGYAEAFEPWQGAVDFHTKVGNERTIGSVDVMIPLQQDENNMLFLDTRGIFTNQDTTEGNVGIGYRCKNCISKNWIFGGYAFWDRRRSQYDNYFSQATIGAEILSDTWDVRINGYQPMSEKRLISQSASSAALSPDGSVLIDNGQVFEKALRGYDIEVGRRLDAEGNTWAHLAFYKFGGWGDPNIDGMRLRLYSDVTDWLRLGAETMYDSPRGHTSFAEMRIRIPFGPKPEKEVSALQKRFYEPIVRDIDIVTQSVSPPKEVMKGSNGETVKVIFVDNTAVAGGDGSQASPYNNLADAETAMARNWIIYVLEGDGTTANMNGGITIDEREVRLIGAGVALTTNEGIQILPAGNAPKITNTGGDAVTIDANDVEVAGFTIDTPTGDGVFVFNDDDANINNITVNNAGLSGVHGLYSIGKNDLTINNVTVSGSTQNGIKLENYNNADITASITNSTASTNTQPGIFVQGNNGSKLVLTLENNISTGNGGNGGAYIQNDSTDTMTITSTGNTVTNNNNFGMYYVATGTGTMTVTSSGNTITGNPSNGLSVWAQSKALNATFTNENTSTNATGITLTSSNDADLDVSLNNINSSNNTSSGLVVRNQNTATLAMDMQNTTVAGNGNQGVDIQDTSADTFLADLGGGTRSSAGSNSIYGSTNFDIRLDTATQLKATNNWWGNAGGLQGGDTSLLNGSTIDSSSFLTSDPN
jgi:hypothetical protein